MTFKVQFSLEDGMGRITRRTFTNTQATIALAIADVAVLGPLWDAITKGGLKEVNISQKDAATTFVADTVSNIDTGMTLTVLGGNGQNHAMRIPMPIEALKLAGGAVDTSNAALLAYIDEFAIGNTWRVNNDNPTNVVSIVRGEINK